MTILQDAPTQLVAWAERPAWDDENDTVLVCRRRSAITHDVTTFVFEALAPRRFDYEPGQFVTIGVEIDGTLTERCYTISSSPTRPFTIAITVKRVPGGVVSNWLHDNLQPGHTINARGPLGQFTCADYPADKYLFLSGGSGITPVMSMLRTLHDLSDDTDVVFVHSARTPIDIVFRRELAEIASTSPAVQVAHVCETDAPTEAWEGHRGRLTIETLTQICPDFLDREVFVCGPGPYMSAVKSLLADAGFDMDRYHQESFVLDELLADSAAVDDSDADAILASSADGETDTGFDVEFTKSNTTIHCPAGTPVLDAATKAGLNMPSSCGQGLCGTCKVTLVSGEVDMQHNGGIRPKEIAQNKILLCCSKPRTPLVVDA
ncbi:FAD-binding oxidoreductase [Rhodococcus koreensis]